MRAAIYRHASGVESPVIGTDQGHWSCSLGVGHVHRGDDGGVVRHLVVLDLGDDPDAAEGVVQFLRGDGRPRIGGATLNSLADQIEAQTRPPEPGKYGAVIAGDGLEWFRYTTSEVEGRDWCRPDPHNAGDCVYARWDQLDVLRVTNTGVLSGGD